MKVEKVKIIVGIAILSMLTYPVLAESIFKLKNVTVYPTKGKAPLTINISGEIVNIGNESGNYSLFVGTYCEYQISRGNLKPNETKYFNFTLTEKDACELGLPGNRSFKICVAPEIFFYNLDVYKITLNITGYADFKLRNVTVEPTEGVRPLTVTISGEVYNNGTIDGLWDILLMNGSELLDVYPGHYFACSLNGTSQSEKSPSERSENFSFNYTFDKEGLYNLTIKVRSFKTCNCLEDVSWGYTDEVGPILIKVYKELDRDHDGWDDNVEQIIHKYYPEFDPINETPTWDDVVQAVIGMVKKYFSTVDPEVRDQIIKDLIPLVNEYFEELG